MVHNGLYDQNIVDDYGYTKQVVLTLWEMLVKLVMRTARIFLCAGVNNV